MKRSYAVYGWVAGLTLVAMVHTVCAVTTFFVSTDGSGDGSSWASPTNSIQGAIDASDNDPASIVYVTNGVYDVGGVSGYPAAIGPPNDDVINRVAIHKPIIVRSWNLSLIHI